MPAEMLRRTLAEAGVSAYLSRTGFIVEGASEGTARARLRYTGANLNRASAIHGGAIATVLLGAAELAAASSERVQHDAVLRCATLSISFLDAVRGQDDVVASARVLRRGRDTLHVVAEATHADVVVATALFAHQVVSEAAAQPQPSRAAACVRARGGRLAGSEYMGAAGARILDAEGGWSCMSLPLAPNEGAPGRIHEGAVVGLIDTCAALAAFGDADEHRRARSATVSLSMAWSGPLDDDLEAGARVLDRRGLLHTCEAEVWSARAGTTRAAALVCYRIAGTRP